MFRKLWENFQIGKLVKAMYGGKALIRCEDGGWHVAPINIDKPGPSREIHSIGICHNTPLNALRHKKLMDRIYEFERKT